MQELPNATMADADLLTRDAAAARLGVSRRTLNRYIADGRLAATELGNRRYIAESAIRGYLDRAVQLGEVRREKTARQKNRRGRNVNPAG